MSNKFINPKVNFTEKTYTPKQQEVMDIKTGYNMVLAGPGCGKTDILAERVARAYENDNKALDEMLCLTFTNRAAREMFNKIRNRLGSDDGDLFVGNIHRYCSHFLFDNGEVDAEASIMDEEDTKEVLSSLISEKDIKNLLEYESYENFYGNRLASLNWEIINELFRIDIRPSSSTGRVTESTVNKVISAVRIKVMDMQHIIYQIEQHHPYEDWYHKEILETETFHQYYPTLQAFKNDIINIQTKKKD